MSVISQVYTLVPLAIMKRHSRDHAPVFGDFLLLIQGNVESKWPMSQDLNSSGQFQNAEIIDLKNKKVTV